MRERILPYFDGIAAARSNLSLFQVVFVAAALIALFLTFYTIFSVDPTRPFSGMMPSLIGVNFVLIAVLGVLLVRRYLNLQRDRTIEEGNRLVRRFMLLFGLSSVLPATIVAIVLGATVTRGLDTWFSSRIGTIVEETAELSREGLDTASSEIAVRAQSVASVIDYPDTALALRNDSARFAEALGLESLVWGFRAAFIVNSDGEPALTATVEQPIAFVPPTESALGEADQGLVGQTLYEGIGLVSATIKLGNMPGLYLHLLTEVNPETLSRLRTAESALTQYRQAEAVSGRLQTFFGIGYAQIIALAVLLFGRLGLEAGNQIARPIGRLANAAQAVRDGDFSTRVAPPRNDDEIDALTTSFNTMTAQLGSQRKALEKARSESEDRRQFLETLLAEVSAGVIRTDASMNIVLANPSAEALIAKGELQGRTLHEAVPEFRPHAHKAVRDGGTDDASLELSLGGSIRYIRLRSVADDDGGCVLTFDDATRIVTAQRHMAWRDVARRIAHEIKNPLTPIQLAAERLSRRYGKTLGEQDDVFERSLETITRQVADIGRMVESFSNFARMPKPQIERFNLSAMLKETAFARGMVTPDISIDVQVPEVELWYSGDERLLDQAFGNLLKNAAEAILSAPEEKEVAGQIDVSLKQVGEKIEIEIVDNGPGFPVEDRDRLLEPYMTTRERGSGLGLAIVSRVMIDHGGSISLHDRADGLGGGRVRVTLPILENDPEAGSDSSADAKTNNKELA
ncbi:MAG: PAS domain-containing sensor histidine kinase [Pseudomonadota bacterium]